MNIPPKYEDVVAQLGAERELHKIATETLGQFADENQKLHADLTALREELNQYEPASPGTASKRARWLLNIQDACKYGLPKHLVNRLNNTAKEIQNSIKFGGTKRLRDENESLQQRLTVAEQRADELEGLLREISSDELFPIRQRLWMRVVVALKPAAEMAAYCTHPPGCKQCSWCGFKAEPKLAAEGEGS